MVLWLCFQKKPLVFCVCFFKEIHTEVFKDESMLLLGFVSEYYKKRSR